jgi:uncharacterized protein (DUF4415 family)
MSVNKPVLPPEWDDPDLPELTDELLDVAEFSIGGKVVRPATGYLGPNGVVRGRPPQREVAKRQVTLRLDPDVIDRFRADGPGWQGRMNAALRRAAGL